MTHSAVLGSLLKYSGRQALSGVSGAMTYDALAQEVETLAKAFVHETAVAILMENCPAWIVADLACIRAGVVCVPLPPFFTDEQVRHALKDAGVSLVLTDQPERFQGEAQALEIADVECWVLKQKNAAVRFPKDTAKVTYTSGTTGNPKGVCLAQAAMETVAQSLLTVLGPEVAARHVSLLPLAVLLENVAGVYTSLLAGGICYLPKVVHQPEALVTAIMEHQATSCILVPELLRMLLAPGQPLPSLKFAAVGGARVDPALLEAAHSRGISVYEGYGLSEASSVVTLNSPGVNRVGSAGRPLPHVALKISPDGEILLKDPLFSGYLSDGDYASVWYATGDLGRIDAEGFLHIEGRRHNVFITSFGRNVSPEWPESLLTAHPAILQAAVFGEEKPVAAAVIVPRSAADIPAALSQVNARLPDYARIGHYVLADEPFSVANGQLTGTGRIRRDAIEAAYSSQIEQCHRQEKTA